MATAPLPSARRDESRRLRGVHLLAPFLQSEGGTPDRSRAERSTRRSTRPRAGNKSANGYGKRRAAIVDEGRIVRGGSVSPPYNPPMSQDHNGSRAKARHYSERTGAFVKYGNAEGQLEGMSMDGFEAAVSSPPYSAMQVEKNARASTARSSTKPTEIGRRSDLRAVLSHAGTALAGYGILTATSPTCRRASLKRRSAVRHTRTAIRTIRRLERFHDHHEPLHANDIQREAEYVQQMVNSPMRRLLLAARAIVEQVYLALAPGGHAVWVVKNYVKNKQIVPFSDQWRALCEAVGFVTLHEHHAIWCTTKHTAHA